MLEAFDALCILPPAVALSQKAFLGREVGSWALAWALPTQFASMGFLRPLLLLVAVVFNIAQWADALVVYVRNMGEEKRDVAMAGLGSNPNDAENPLQVRAPPAAYHPSLIPLLTSALGAARLTS